MSSPHRLLPLLPLLPLLAALACVLLAPPGAAQVDPKAILDQIQDAGEEAQPQLFDQLARIGTEDAWRYSSQAVEEVRSETLLNAAYGAFLHYGKAGDLARRSIDFLAQDAQHHRRDPNQRSAARALARYGDVAAVELETIVLRHREDDVRAIAFVPLLGALSERGDRDSLRLILELAAVGNAAQREIVTQALARYDIEVAFKELTKKFADRSTSRAWRELIVERLATEEHERARQFFVDLLADADPDMRMRAIEIVGARAEPGTEKALWKLLGDSEPTIVRQAAISLSQMMGADEKWQRRLFSLAEDKRPAARMGAAIGLAHLRNGEAIEVLYGLLADEDHRVRIEAVQQVGNLRRKDSIPVLIGRLGVETNRIHADIATALRLITGVDQGNSASRWTAWWNGEGEAFRVPPYDQALAAEMERRDRRENNVSIATFYGLNVVSDRVCFILDTSGSMDSAARDNRNRSSSDRAEGTTRLEVAKSELANVLRAFPLEDLFNIVFFESTVRQWQDELTVMSDDSRADAIAYIGRQRAAGGTAVYDGILRAMEDDLVDTIYLLTDGAPTAGRITNAQQIRSEIRRMNSVRKVQINTISIGQESQLLRWLAEDSGGEYRRIG